MSRPARLLTTAAVTLGALAAVVSNAVPSSAVSPSLGVTCATSTVHITHASTDPIDLSVDCQATDGSAIDSYAIVTAPAHAVAGTGFTFDTTTGELTYLPAANFIGTDSFVFTATSGTVTSSPSQIWFDVDDAAPTCAAVPAQTVAHDRALVVTPTCSDVDGTSPTLVAGTIAPSHGRLAVGSTGLTYTPNAKFVGSDSFTFRSTDGEKSSADQTVQVAVTDAAPVCNAVSKTITHDRALAVPVTCRDADGDPITVKLVAAAQHGTAVHVGPNFLYLPARHYTGADTFTFAGNDGIRDGVPARVSITVTNHLPSISAPSSATTRDGVTVTVSTKDADEDPVTVRIAKAPKHGKVAVRGTRVSYTPVRGFAGTDSFGLVGTDGVAVTGIKTVTVHVLASRPVVKAVTVHKHGAVATVVCEHTAKACSGTATISVKVGRKTISGTAAFKVSANSTGHATVSFSTAERKLLAASHAKKLPATVTLVTRDSAGHRATVRTTVQASRQR